MCAPDLLHKPVLVVLPSTLSTDRHAHPSFRAIDSVVGKGCDPSSSASPATEVAQQPCVALAQSLPSARIGEFARGPLHAYANSAERVPWCRPSLPLHTTPHSLFRAQQTASRYLYSSRNDRPSVSCRGESLSNPTPRGCLPLRPPLTKLVFLPLVSASPLVSL